MRQLLSIIAISFSLLTANAVNAFDFHGASISDKEAPSSYIKYGINGYHPVIGEVVPDTPASRAGFKKGDIILAVNNKSIRKTVELRSIADDVITFTLFNGFERKTSSIDRLAAEAEKSRLKDSGRKLAHDSQLYPQAVEQPDASPPLKFNDADLANRYGNSTYSQVKSSKYRTGKSTRSVDGDRGTFSELQSGNQVSGEGVVVKLLPDDNVGSRHQRFLLRLSSGQTVLVAHNIDLAPRIATLKEGDSVAFNGVFEWNAKGGAIHWTHHDPAGRHEAGWLKHAGRTYQ